MLKTERVTLIFMNKAEKLRESLPIDISEKLQQEFFYIVGE